MLQLLAQKKPNNHPDNSVAVHAIRGLENHDDSSSFKNAISTTSSDLATVIVSS